jgi:hypothetical protein
VATVVVAVGVDETNLARSTGGVWCQAIRVAWALVLAAAALARVTVVIAPLGEAADSVRGAAVAAAAGIAVDHGFSTERAAGARMAGREWSARHVRSDEATPTPIAIDVASIVRSASLAGFRSLIVVLSCCGKRLNERPAGLGEGASVTGRQPVEGMKGMRGGSSPLLGRQDLERQSARSSRGRVSQRELGVTIFKRIGAALLAFSATAIHDVARAVRERDVLDCAGIRRSV